MADTEAPALAEYKVTRAREIFGQFRNVGDVLELTEPQAKYYVAPYGEGLEKLTPKDSPAPVARAAKPRVEDA